jgi:hypothetical protein
MAIRNEELWPCDITKLDGDKTTFAWKVLTVDRVFDQFGYGLKFVEDQDILDDDDKVIYEGGRIWNFKGKWNDSTGKYDAYAGKKYQEGDRVEAQLGHRTYTKKDGSAGEGRDVNRIRPASETSQPSPQAEPAVQGTSTGDFRTTNQKAATGQVLNILVSLTTAGLTDSIGITEDAAFAIIKDAMIGNLEDRPLDLSTLHTLLVPVKEQPPERPTTEQPEEGEEREELDW